MVVLGLGNPGPRYARTRHNAGFQVLDAVAEILGVRLSRLWFRPYALARWRGHTLVKPLGYMNRSGDVLRPLLRRRGLTATDIVVVYDNVDLPPGSFRVKTRGSGGGGHKGMESIHRVLGTTDFRRVAVGVGRPDSRGRLAEYVLQEPSPDEIDVFRRGVDGAAHAVAALLGAAASRAPAERPC